MRHTLQEQIASLMGSGMLGNNGMLQNAGMSDHDEVDTGPPGAQVVDGRANQAQTQLKACSAGSCANNLQGQRCGLTQIEITETGGCGSYEAAADDYDRRDAVDDDTINGISNLMPSDPGDPGLKPSLYDPSQL